MLAFFLLAAALLASPALTAPQPRDAPGAGFTLHVSDPARHRKRDFVRDWAAARQRWGKGIPEDAIAAFSLADGDGQVDIQPMGADALFVADVEIGSPPQRLKLALDTGSSDLWVQSTDTEYNINKAGPWAPQYKPNASDTAQLVEDAEWRVGYVDGTAASGIVYSDTVRLGSFAVPNATVQSAETMAAQFEREPALSGILGLARDLPSNIVPPAPSFLDALRPLLAAPVFTADLRRNASGRFVFGPSPGAAGPSAADNFTWLDAVPGSGYWDVRLDLTAWMGGRGQGGPGATWWYHEFVATVDTGTSLLFLPHALASLYWLSVPGSRADPRLSDAYAFPCDIAKNLPDLLFKLPGSDHVVRVPGPYLNYGPVDDQPDSCWGGLQSARGLDAVILGDVMLKALAVAFDLDRSRVGFANKVLHDVE